LNVESPSRLRWRRDKSVDEADSLTTLKNLLSQALFSSANFFLFEPNGCGHFPAPVFVHKSVSGYFQTPFKTLVRHTGSEIATFNRSYAFQ